jgi:Type I restriction enzyme R protein N terminus (HSDR_N)
MFSDFDFSALDSVHYKEDAVREDLISPLLKALGYQPTGKQRMQRSQSLLHPFVMIGSQKRKVYIIPDYTLFYDNQVVLVLDAKRPSESIINSEHVEQAFSYAIHPEIRAKSYALCNGHEFMLYDIDRSGPVFRVKMTEIEQCWTEVLKHLSPEALLNHYHREFRADLGIFLKNAGFSESQDITFVDTRISSLGQTTGGVLTATTGAEIDGMGLQASFDMPMDVLPAILSCLPPQAAAMVTNALAAPGSSVWIGGVVEINWTVRLGKEEFGHYKHDPLIPLVVNTIRGVTRATSIGVPQDGLPPDTLNIPTILQYMK